MTPDTALAAKVEAETSDALEALDLVRLFEIKTPDDVEFAKDALIDVKRQYSDLETQRKKATGPMREAIKEIDAWFKPAKTALGEMEGLWKGKLKDAAAAAAARQAELLLEARAAETPQEAHVAIVAAGESEIDTSGIQMRQNWVYDVIDPEALPAIYWTIDHKALAAAVRLTKGDTKIPGVKVWNDPIIAASTKARR